MLSVEGGDEVRGDNRDMGGIYFSGYQLVPVYL